MLKNKKTSLCFAISSIVSGLSATPIYAMELDVGNPDLSLRIDNTLKYNYGVRTESADQRWLTTPNSNDGNYNFRKAGTNVTNRIDVLSEMDLVYQDRMGVRVSAASWYDKAYANAGSNSNPSRNRNGTSGGMINTHPTIPNNADGVGTGPANLSNYAKRYYNGPSGEILDAFVFYRAELGDHSSISVKAGQHNVYWGESIISGVHSISYGQAGLDMAKAQASPGISAKELFIPRKQISTNLVVNPELTLGAQYFFSWDPARLPEAGSYYSGGDMIGHGAKAVLAMAGPKSFMGEGQLINIPRTNDYEPDQRGDWGLMAQWSPEWLDGTLGFYYRQTSDIMPQVVVDLRSMSMNGTCGNPLCNNIESLAGQRYSLAYSDDIDVYGISLAKMYGDVSIGSDLSVRKNMPLSSIGVNISAAGPGGIKAGLGGALPPRGDTSGVVTELPGDGDSMRATGTTLHWTLNGMVAFAGNSLYDSASLVTELFYSNLLSIDSHNKALYKGQSSYAGIDKSTRSNFGLAINFTPTWFQVFPGVDMSMPLSINGGIRGVSPVAGGGAEGAGSYSIGVSSAFYNKYYADLKYVDSFSRSKKCNNMATDGANPSPTDPAERYTCFPGGYSSSNGGAEDRGAVYLTLSTSF